MTADEIAFTWRPGAVFSQGIVIQGTGCAAHRRRVAVVEHCDAVAAIPRAADCRGDRQRRRRALRRGPSARVPARSTESPSATKAAPRAHRVDRLSLVTSRGAITGGVALDATAPFALEGKLGLVGDAALRDAHADIVVSGTLASVALDAAGRAGDANFTLRARLAPLAAVVLDEIALDAANIDLATWDAGLPATRISGTVKARPLGDALAGQFEATNAIPGPIDARRLPLRSLAARFSWRSDLFALDDIVGRGGRRPRDGPGTDSADRRRGAMDARSCATSTSSRSTRRRLRPDSPARSMPISRRAGSASAATSRTERWRRESLSRSPPPWAMARSRSNASASAPEMASSPAPAAIGLAGDRAFAVTAKATGFDPSRFGAFPAGKLDADIAAKGALQPAWRVTADVVLAAGSRLTGLPASGSFHANLSSRTMHDAAIDLKLGSAVLTARGGFGGADDRLAVAIDAPRLGELAPLVPARVPRPLAGALRTRLTLTGGLERTAAELQARGESLRIGTALALATVELRLGIEPPDSASPPATEDARRITAEMTATGIVAPTGNYSRANASVAGTLAQHRVAIAIAGEDIDVEAAAHGAVRESTPGAGTAGWTWSGTVDALQNRGEWALRLAAPATLEIARDRVHVGAARVEVADGSVDLAALSWDDGRVTTKGAFTGVPVATLAKLSGYRLPFVSTLALAGDWSLAATPRLNGTLNVRRERGDFFVGAGASTVGTGDRALQITAFELSARVRDDAVDATATLRSGRGANADGTLTILAAPDAPPGRITAAAPMQLALRAELPTLQVLQPWIGTAAVVDGKLRAELSARGNAGTRAAFGHALRQRAFPRAPQHGVHFTDGRLEATARRGRRSGSTNFPSPAAPAASRRRAPSRRRASGRATVRAPPPGSPGTRSASACSTAPIAGSSRRVRHARHPRSQAKDRRHARRRRGTFRIHGGRARDARGRRRDQGGQKVRAADGAGANDFPLTLDLELDLGEKLTFVGEGLDTGLRGKVRVTTARRRQPARPRHDPGRERDVSRVRPAPRHRSRPSDLRRADRQPGPRHRRAAQEPGGRGRRRRERHGQGPDRPAHVESRPCPTTKNSRGSCSARASTARRAPTSPRCRRPPPRCSDARGKPVTSSIAESVGLDDISVHVRYGRAARHGVGGVHGFRTGRRVRQAPHRQALARLRAGAHVATNALRLEYSSHAHADAARRGRRDQRRRHLLPADVRVAA